MNPECSSWLVIWAACHFFCCCCCCRRCRCRCGCGGCCGCCDCACEWLSLCPIRWLFATPSGLQVVGGVRISFGSLYGVFMVAAWKGGCYSQPFFK